METSKVRADMPILTKDLAGKIISQAVHHTWMGVGGSQEAFAQTIGCGRSTVNNAINCKNLMEVDSVFNLLRVDPYAIEGLLQHFGRRSVPIEAKCNTDALVTTSAVVHDLAQARGKNLTDYECLECEGSIDAALEALAGLKNRCLEIRKGRAA